MTLNIILCKLYPIDSGKSTTLHDLTKFTDYLVLINNVSPSLVNKCSFRKSCSIYYGSFNLAISCSYSACTNSTCSSSFCMSPHSARLPSKVTCRYQTVATAHPAKHRNKIKSKRNLRLIPVFFFLGGSTLVC